MKRIIVFSFLFLLFFNNWAQPQIQTFLSNDTIRFAQKTRLNINITAPKQTPVFMMRLLDTLTNNLEIIKISVDTVESKDNFIYKYHIDLVAFDDTVFSIPAIPFRVGERLVLSDSNLQLVVLPIERDSLQLAKIDTSQIIDIFDVKPPINPRLTFKELWLRYRYILLGILLALLAFYFIRKIIKKIKVKKTLQKSPQQLIPPHQLALNRLNELEKKRLYQKGNYKDYYFELTEILREYLEARFHIRALESTTNELILLLKYSEDISDELKSKLFELLRIADLSKFAKFSPDNALCQKHLEFAYNFIEQTKLSINAQEQSDISTEVNNQEN